MKLLHNTYGKDHVRVLRVSKDGDRRTISELTVKALITGDFARHYTDGDNATAICTDTVKNVVNVVARENLTAGNEKFCKAVAEKLLGYPQCETATVEAKETKWSRLSFDGKDHPHAFTLDGNGMPFAKVAMTRSGAETTSGVSGYTFLKATESGWVGFYKDKYTTLKETTDRIAATSMEATWRWRSEPASYEEANKKILDTMIEVFATTYSKGIQDSLFRMASAALEAVPEISEISAACPNKHYIPINLEPFGLGNDNQVFVVTAEPFGQIECTVGRD